MSLDFSVRLTLSGNEEKRLTKYQMLWRANPLGLLTHGMSKMLRQTRRKIAMFKYYTVSCCEVATYLARRVLTASARWSSTVSVLCQLMQASVMLLP